MMIGIDRWAVAAAGLLLVAVFSQAMAGAATYPKPGLPGVLAFRLEDGRHQTSGLSLSFALPGQFKYECHRILFRQDRRGQVIEIALLGVEPVDDDEGCRKIKEPAPIRERVLLPLEPGNFQIIFVNGGR